jgi:hypothetical protein
MANLSDQTRAQQVLNYLRVRKGQWVDGPDLANEKVGGSEGLRRLRDEKERLAGEGLRVEKRKHPEPDRDIWQYRLVDGPTVPAAGGADRPSSHVAARPESTPLKYERLPTKLAFGEAIPCPGCDGKGRRVDPGTRKQGPCTRCNGFGIVPVPRV